MEERKSIMKMNIPRHPSKFKITIKLNSKSANSVFESPLCDFGNIVRGSDDGLAAALPPPQPVHAPTTSERSISNSIVRHGRG